MATPATNRTRASIEPDRTVVYRNIKIAPLYGKRSATAKVIRDALRLHYSLTIQSDSAIREG